MSIKEGLLIELERETANTRRIIDRLSDEHLSFKPHPKSMSLGDLAGHIVELHGWLQLALNTADFDLQTSYKPFKPTSVSALKDALESGYQSNIEAVKSFSDENWSDLWRFHAGDYVIAELPKIGALRFLVHNHLIHHRGQLSVYLRLLDIPVPGLYGPSADEQQG